MEKYEPFKKEKDPFSEKELITFNNFVKNEPSNKSLILNRNIYTMFIVLLAYNIIAFNSNIII